MRYPVHTYLNHQLCESLAKPLVITKARPQATWFWAQKQCKICTKSLQNPRNIHAKSVQNLHTGALEVPPFWNGDNLVFGISSQCRYRHEMIMSTSEKKFLFSSFSFSSGFFFKIHTKSMQNPCSKSAFTIRTKSVYLKMCL